jgi:hypothetical protein
LFTIASGLDRPRAALLAEVVKCQLLCVLHHREKTKRELCGLPLAGASQVRGERHGLAKITEDEVRNIRSSPASARRLAQQLGLAHSTVVAVRNNLTWKHVV